MLLSRAPQVQVLLPRGDHPRATAPSSPPPPPRPSPRAAVELQLRPPLALQRQPALQRPRRVRATIQPHTIRLSSYNLPINLPRQIGRQTTRHLPTPPTHPAYTSTNKTSSSNWRIWKQGILGSLPLYCISVLLVFLHCTPVSRMMGQGRGGLLVRRS